MMDSGFDPVVEEQVHIETMLDRFVAARIRDDEQSARRRRRWVTRPDATRILRAVDAKRRQLRIAESLDNLADSAQRRGLATGYAMQLHLLASSMRRSIAVEWSTHPEYQEAWKP